MGAMASVGSPADYDVDGSPYARKDAWLLSVALDRAANEEKVKHATELCTFIEEHILANETERTVFRSLKAGQSITDIASALGVTKPEIQKVFNKIKQKTHAYYNQEAA
jgi:DNA-binding NarL/FixJ family response regulator